MSFYGRDGGLIPLVFISLRSGSGGCDCREYATDRQSGGLFSLEDASIVKATPEYTKYGLAPGYKKPCHQRTELSKPSASSQAWSVLDRITNPRDRLALVRNALKCSSTLGGASGSGSNDSGLSQDATDLMLTGLITKDMLDHLGESEPSRDTRWEAELLSEALSEKYDKYISAGGSASQSQVEALGNLNTPAGFRSVLNTHRNTASRCIAALSTAATDLEQTFDQCNRFLRSNKDNFREVLTEMDATETESGTLAIMEAAAE